MRSRAFARFPRSPTAFAATAAAPNCLITTRSSRATKAPKPWRFHARSVRAKGAWPPVCTRKAPHWTKSARRSTRSTADALGRSALECQSPQPVDASANVAHGRLQFRVRVLPEVHETLVRVESARVVALGFVQVPESLQRPRVIPKSGVVDSDGSRAREIPIQYDDR